MYYRLSTHHVQSIVGPLVLELEHAQIPIEDVGGVQKKEVAPARGLYLSRSVAARPSRLPLRCRGGARLGVLKYLKLFL